MLTEQPHRHAAAYDAPMRLREAAAESMGYLAEIGKENDGHDHPHALVLSERLRAALSGESGEPTR